MEERTGWRGRNESQIGGEEKRNGRHYGAAETSKERAEWRGLQQKNLNILGLPKKKEWPQCHSESSWQERGSRPCQKEKEQSRQSKAPDNGRGESHTLARERGIRARAWSGKGGLHDEQRWLLIGGRLLLSVVLAATVGGTGCYCGWYWLLLSVVLAATVGGTGCYCQWYWLLLSVVLAAGIISSSTLSFI